MATNLRTPTQRRDDRERISELLLKGWSQKKIAAEMGLSTYTVNRDVAAIERLRRIYMVKNLDEVRRRELAKIDLMEKEAWDAWERSKQPLKKKKTKSVSNIPTAMEKIEEERIGAKQYLDTIQWCIERRAQLLGLDAPVRTELSGLAGGPIEHAHSLKVDDMSELFKAIQQHKKEANGSSS